MLCPSRARKASQVVAWRAGNILKAFWVFYSIRAIVFSVTKHSGNAFFSRCLLRAHCIYNMSWKLFTHLLFWPQRLKLKFAPQEKAVSWITAGSFGMSQYRLGFPGVHTCSWIFVEFVCGIFYIKSNIEFGWYLGSTGKNNIHFISIWNYVQKFISISFHLNLLNWGNRGRKLKKTQMSNRGNLEHFLWKSRRLISMYVGHLIRLCFLCCVILSLSSLSRLSICIKKKLSINVSRTYSSDRCSSDKYLQPG